MGEVVLAATKCTHVPTVLTSEQDGPIKGKRQSARITGKGVIGALAGDDQIERCIAIAMADGSILDFNAVRAMANWTNPQPMANASACLTKPRRSKSMAARSEHLTQGAPYARSRSQSLSQLQHDQA